MYIEQLDKYRYWYDEDGQLWRLVSWCEHPTATFERVNKFPSNDENNLGQIGGAIGSLILSGLKPVEIEKLR